MGLNCYDIERNALTFDNRGPIIAHPPCRSWGQLSHLCNYDKKEHQLTLWAIRKVRSCGGVLEHPVASKILGNYIPKPGIIDKYGGFTICINQHWFGHNCKKKTILYICGCNPKDIPPHSLNFDYVTHTISQSRNINKSFAKKKECSSAYRQKTPPRLADYLFQIALICNPFSSLCYK